jgi:hypothetical protein
VNKKIFKILWVLAHLLITISFPVFLLSSYIIIVREVDPIKNIKTTSEIDEYSNSLKQMIYYRQDDDIISFTDKLYKSSETELLNSLFNGSIALKRFNLSNYIKDKIDGINLQNK